MQSARLRPVPPGFLRPSVVYVHETRRNDQARDIDNRIPDSGFKVAYLNDPGVTYAHVGLNSFGPGSIDHGSADQDDVLGPRCGCEQEDEKGS